MAVVFLYLVPLLLAVAFVPRVQHAQGMSHDDSTLNARNIQNDKTLRHATRSGETADDTISEDQKYTSNYDTIIKESEADGESLPTTSPSESAVEAEETERIKRRILERLGLPAAPKLGGPLPPLPMDFYMNEKDRLGDDKSQNEDDRVAEVNRPRVREIFISGQDSKFYYILNLHFYPKQNN